MSSFRCDHGKRSCEDCSECNSAVTARTANAMSQPPSAQQDEQLRRTLFRDRSPRAFFAEQTRKGLIRKGLIS